MNEAKTERNKNVLNISSRYVWLVGIPHVSVVFWLRETIKQFHA
jgi:hypothetical protein